MVLASEKTKSLSLHIGGLTIQLRRSQLYYREAEAPESMSCTSPRDHLEEESRTIVSQPTNDRRDYFPSEGGSV